MVCREEYALDLGDSMVESMISSMGEDIEPDEKEEMLKDYREEVLPQIREQLDNPQQFRQMINDQAKKQYMTTEQLRAEIESHTAQLRGDEDVEIDEDALINFERAYEEVFEYTAENDRIVGRLVEIAERDGLEKAIQKETRHEVIRERFPTPESFREYSLKAQESIKSVFQGMSGALMADGEAGQIAGSMNGAMGGAIDKMLRINEKLQRDYVERTITEIYG